jgi:hypothetical protein
MYVSQRIKLVDSLLERNTAELAQALLLAGYRVNRMRSAAEIELE